MEQGFRWSGPMMWTRIMQSPILSVFIAAVGLITGSQTAASAELKIDLNGPASVVRRSIRYQCEGGAKAGLPANGFNVEYLNDGTNSLAVLPISGRSVIFVNVTSGSGARYVAGSCTWWEAAGRSVSLSVNSLEGTTQYTCHRAAKK